jgi:flavin-dependent trigonelline monooxygenase, oxygenase component
MRFGLYAELQTPPGRPDAEVYSELLRQMEHADRVGFDVYSIIEHLPQFSISCQGRSGVSGMGHLAPSVSF